MSGAWVALAVILVLVAAAGFGAELLKDYKRYCNKEDGNGDKSGDKLSTFSSSEAVKRWCNLGFEFDGLVNEIAHYRARKAKKLATTLEAQAGLPKEKEISPQDMDKAFLEAIRELQLTEIGCGVACDRKPLLERIKELRKKYEFPTP